MDISLTVSYHVKIEKDAFFNPETGELNDEIEKQLEKLFSDKIELSEQNVAIKNYLSHYPLYEGKNCLRCAACGRWLYMPGKEDMAEGLDYCKIIKGISFCHSCAWELENEIDRFLK